MQNRRLWIAGVGGLAIVLAVLLMPRPDTGADAPPANPDNKHPRAQMRNGVTRPGMEGIKPIQRPIAMQPGPNPAAAEYLQRSATPEAVYAGRITGPLAMIRRSLVLSEDEAAKPLSDEAMTLITDLREVRRDPTGADFGTLEARVKDYASRVKASEWAKNPDMAIPLAKIDQYLTEYHTNPQVPNYTTPATPMSKPPLVPGAPAGTAGEATTAPQPTPEAKP